MTNEPDRSRDPDADEPDETTPPVRPSFPLMFEDEEEAEPSLSRRLRERLKGKDKPETAPPSKSGPASGSPGAADATPASSTPRPNPEPARPSRAAPDPGASPPVHRATLQMLPGRLQPLDPEVIRQEVRFLRERGTEPVVTLGWDVGEPPDHVTLDHPSILPRHARMRYREGQWYIESLSAEDPIRVNGSELPPEEGPRLLWSEDVVSLGEVDFRFLLT